jgi:hypothetical protein
MAQTLRVVFPAAQCQPLTDILASIYNDEQTDLRRYFEVIKVVGRPKSSEALWQGGGGTYDRQEKQQYYRVSSVSGGEVMTAAKHDTASASLPSQVTCVAMPDRVVTTDRLLSRSDNGTLRGTTVYSSNAPLWFASAVFGKGISTSLHGQSDITRFGKNTSVEAFVLREGEGFTCLTNVPAFAHSQNFSIVITNLSSGATYEYFIARAGSTGDDLPMFAVMNASGSGITISVRLATSSCTGEDWTGTCPRYRLARTVGNNSWQAGQVYTPVQDDTGTAIPSALVCAGGVASAKFVGEGMLYDWNTTHGATFAIAQQQNAGVFRRHCNKPRFLDFSYSNNGAIGSGDEDYVLFKATAGRGIVIRPSEGLALLVGSNTLAQAIDSMMALYMDVEFTILHYPPSGGTFPVEDDVEFGVVYGPTDNLTGTVTLPTEAQVETGVQYGADGTEFTGTLSGGGGNTYSRGRVVNR